VGTLFSALDIGRAGLSVAQIQLDVAGHNIANVNKVGYSRQRVDITTRVPNYTPYGALGRGPAVSGIERLRERFLDTTYREQVPGFGEARTQAQFYSRIEDVFQEPDERGFGTRITQFFDALNDFANNVEDLPTRVSMLEETRAVAASLNDVDQRINILRTSANNTVRDEIERVNSLVDRIAAMNGTIRDAELTGRQANDLRDDRDVIIDELAEIVNVRIRERDDGQMDILLDGSFLVNGERTFHLEGELDPTIDPRRPDFLRVQFASSGQPALIQSGSLAGALQIRDVELGDLQDRFDALAASLIQSMNAIHSQGNGNTSYSGPLTTSNAVSDPDASLANGADLPFDLVDGSFQVVVYDASGQEVLPALNIPITTTGPLAAQTTLNDVALAIEVHPNLSATVNSDGQLVITPAAGFSFHFANDSSGALVALGANGLFQGSTAGDIRVNQALVDNPGLLTSGFSTDAAETGDNTAALAMAALRNAAIVDGDTQTLSQYYESAVVGVGINARANEDLLTVEVAFVEDLSRRRAEVSGVNLDEEVTSLILFQRAFEASARVISVADRMLETLISLGR
jgi:flagellar hook-associated protein 1 FlgK